VLSDPRLDKERQTLFVSQFQSVSESVISQLRVKSTVIECIEMTTGEIIVILQKAVLV
jgi:hypothetical protein